MKYQFRSFFITFIFIVSILTLSDLITHNSQMYEVTWKSHVMGEASGCFQIGNIYLNCIIGTCIGIVVNIGHNIFRALDKILTLIGGR